MPTDLIGKDAFQEVDIVGITRSISRTIGTRFNDRITGKMEEFAKNAKIVHIDIEPTSISRNIVVDIPIVADAKEAISVLLEKAKPVMDNTVSCY